MLRDELRRGTEIGIAADELTRRGQLVPDSMVIGLVENWLSARDGSFVFDGFPRTLAQGIELEKLLLTRQTPLDAVFFFNVSQEVIRERVLHRVTCEECGRIFSIGLQVAAENNPCPVCRGHLVHRSDDTLEALEQRMNEYRQKTEPLVPFYREAGLLVELAAAESPEAVFSEISTVMEAA